GTRHAQDRDGPRARGAARAGTPRAHAAAGPRRAPLRGAARRGGRRRGARPRHHGRRGAVACARGRRRQVRQGLVRGVTGRPFLLVGLTGGIATGKSTVSALLRELGAEIIDADILAREVVEPGEPALAEIAAEFGPGVLDAAGRLDRKALGAVVFADPERRRKLEAFTHP